MSVGTSLADSTFDEFVGSSDRTVVVDFWAEWCHPCRLFDPVLTELAARDDRMQLASVDIDANPELARRFAVMSAPTLLVFRHGALAWRAVGARSLARLADDLEPYLGSDPVAVS